MNEISLIMPAVQPQDSTSIVSPDPRQFMSDIFPDETKEITNHVVYTISPVSALSKDAMDATGHFPVTSTRGSDYILMGYHVDANNLQARPTKNRTAGEFVHVWYLLHSYFSECGSVPELYVLDNECSNDLKQAFTKYNIKW
mmetsp:Transcript_11267/g.15893  ORF Transcript_11267/g.15893 Transcript_11267/m.15893 type:complete len:142 (+) Transcript_11267:1420-1845(+)